MTHAERSSQFAPALVGEGVEVSPALQDRVQICPDSCGGKWEELHLFPLLPPPPTYTTTTTTTQANPPPNHRHWVPLPVRTKKRENFFFTLDHMIAHAVCCFVNTRRNCRTACRKPRGRRSRELAKVVEKKLGSRTDFTQDHHHFILL